MKHSSLALVFVACSNDGTGAAQFDTWGEAYIEEGIPATAFADGWSVKYDHFLLAFQEVTLRTARGAAPTASMTSSKVFDMVSPGIKSVVGFTGLKAEPLPFVSYEIAPPTALTELGVGATEANRQALVDAGASLLVEGTATKGSVTKRFTWTFTTPTLFDECRGTKDGKETEGVVVTNGGTDTVQLTIHGDHLFYDDLQSPEAVLRFDSIAKADDDGNADGVVTQTELAAVKLANLSTDLGYGTGSAGNVDDLGAFVAALARTVGHFRGEGECYSRNVTP